MKSSLFESFRATEPQATAKPWVETTRRRKDSIKPFTALLCEGAGNRRALGRGRAGVAREIKMNQERGKPELRKKRRSRAASWLNLKQLQEPRGAPREFTSTSRS